MLFLFYVTQMAQISQIFLAHGNIYMSHRNSQKSRRSSSARLLPEGRKKVPSARAALRMRSENFNEFLRPSGSKRAELERRDFRVTKNILMTGLQCCNLVSREACIQGYHPVIYTSRPSASLYFESLSLMSLVKKPNSSP